MKWLRRLWAYYWRQRVGVLYQTGLAACVACDHRWQAVFPIEASELECPYCHTMNFTNMAIR